MDSEGQDSAKGTPEGQPVSNVVQFPRDWIGPSEELIPFGPRAGPVAVDPPDLPSASDFWGEHAAAMHSVLEDPTVTPPAAEQLDDEAGTSPARRGGFAWRPRIAARAVLAAAAAGLVVVVVSYGELSPPKRPLRATSSAFLESVGRRLTASDAIVDAVRRESVRTSLDLRPSPVPRRPRLVHHRAAPPRGGSTTPSGVSVAVHYSPPLRSTPATVSVAPPTSSAGETTAGATVSGPSGSTSTNSGSNSSSGPSARAAGGASNSGPAGPVGPGAPFGPGHLG